jgi:hypothetical protein
LGESLPNNPELKFEGKLEKDNRWVVMSELIPWSEFESEYAENFSEIGLGASAKQFRIALGSLIIKEKLGISDRETVEQIKGQLIIDATCAPGDIRYPNDLGLLNQARAQTRVKGASHFLFSDRKLNR